MRARRQTVAWAALLGLVLVPVATRAEESETAPGAESAAEATATPEQAEAEAAPPSEAPAPRDAPSPHDGKRILVSSLRPVGADEVLVENLTKVFAFSLADTLPGATVLGDADIQSLLELEAQKQMMGCSDAGCLTELGGAIGADLLATGSVGRIGERYLLDVRLLDSTTGKVLRHVQDQLEGDPEMVAEAIEQMAAHLVDERRPMRAGLLKVMGRGQVTLDGTPIGKAPIRKVPATAGEHHLLWTPDGEPRPTGELRLEVEPYTVTEVVPEPFKARWDLRGLYASFAIGTSPGQQVNGEVNDTSGAAIFARGRIGYAFQRPRIGFHIGRSLEEGDVALDVATVGMSYRAGNALQLTAAMDFGVGALVYADLLDESFDETELVSVIQPSVSLTYVLARYFEAGLSIAVNYSKLLDHDAGTTSGTTLITIGFPPWNPKAHPQMNFHKSELFWTSAVTVLVGTALAGLARGALHEEAGGPDG